MLTNYSHLLATRANKHFRGSVSHSSFRFVLFVFISLGSAVRISQSKCVYANCSNEWKGMVHVNVLRSTEFPSDLFTFYTVTFSIQIYDGKKRTSEDRLRSECYIELSGVFGLD